MELRKTAEPAIAAWLHSEIGELTESLGSELPMLGSVAKRSERRGAPALADDVLAAWHRELARQRHIVGHAEVSFVEQARRAGWSEERISSVLGLDDDVEVQAHVDALESLLVRTHPSQRLLPWTG
ncbi:MAG: hypothetical protein L0I76_31240 [Pseudonocardia sp.]|nr:hypothetical protein [Pseudonocardia sp.]